MDASHGQPAASEPSAFAPDAADTLAEPRYLVGVGASAGGLQALIELVKGVPLDELALVIVQHLSPTHESLLVPLLAPHTRAHVEAARDGVRIMRGHIYVIPPNTDLVIEKHTLRVSARQPAHAPRLPIDRLFTSLARDHGRMAVGVVLSGTGSDGSEGLRAIKAGGGTTFVREPSTAQFEGMPRSALASGAADHCLAPAALTAALRRLSQGDDAASPPPPPARSDALHDDEPYARASSRNRAAAIESHGACASWWCSPSTTCCVNLRSRGSISSAVATCSSIYSRKRNAGSYAPYTTHSNPAGICCSEPPKPSVMPPSSLRSSIARPSSTRNGPHARCPRTRASSRSPTNVPTQARCSLRSGGPL